jgi:hypothetical protein
MKCVNVLQPELSRAPVGCDVRLPMGILGFEQMKNYLLIANASQYSVQHPLPLAEATASSATA